MSWRLTVLLVIAAVATASPALAADRVSADFVLVTEHEVVNDDLYAVGNRIDIRGVVQGDLIAIAGDEVVVSGRVEGDVLAIAPNVVIEGMVTGSVRAVGTSLSLSGTVSEDMAVVAWTGSLAGSIDGDVLVWARKADLSGEVDGSVGGQVWDQLTLAGTINEDVEITTGSLKVRSTAIVLGDLGYRSDTRAEFADGAQVAGQFIQRRPVTSNVRVRAAFLLARLLIGLVFVGLGLSIMALFTPTALRLIETLRHRWLRSVSLALGVILGAAALTALVVWGALRAQPDVAFLLLAVLAPLVGSLWLLLLLALLISPVIGVALVGRLIVRDRGAPPGWFLLGAAILFVAWPIPILGPLLWTLAALAGFGAILATASESGSRSHAAPLSRGTPT